MEGGFEKIIINTSFLYGFTNRRVKLQAEDTPGTRELGAESADLSKAFDDIEVLASRCKFNNCTHISEPGCAILQALSDGKLEERRLDSYLKLKIEAGYDGLNSKEIEVKKLERMFKDVSGMKNMRRFAKEKRK